ncbi:CHAT domain-containing protein [Mycena capillaripes]|nr:CHAT domain-containing protein [Mycena capillaripes]
MICLRQIKKLFAWTRFRKYNPDNIQVPGKVEEGSEDINKTIELHREALAFALSHADQGQMLSKLGLALCTRFEQQGQLKDIHEAIELHRKALALFSPPHPDRSMFLNNLAIAVKKKFEQEGDLKDLEEAIGFHREALALQGLHHPGRGMFLNNLAIAVRTRFQQQGDPKDLNEAIVLHREALTSFAVSHQNRGACLNSLANAVRKRFDQQGDPKDLDEAIELHREALALFTPPHPNRGVSLNNLANAIQTRFEEALIIHTPPHPNHGMSLNNLANAIQTRFEQKGDSKDLDEVIELQREALAIHTPSHLYHCMSLNNLANAIKTRFEQQGDSKDLDEAIALYRQALTLFTLHHSDRGRVLNNLADAVHTRFKQERDPKDLDEVIKLHREALALCTPPHPGRGALQMRFKQQRSSKDIEEAIELHREALALHASPHPSHSASLNNLANAVQTRFEQKGNLQDLEEAIELHKKALALHPPLHPNRSIALSNLANAIQTRFEQKGDSKDLEEAIELHRQALILHVPPQPGRIISLTALGLCFAVMYRQSKHSGHLDQACAFFREAAMYLSSSPRTRFHHACVWAFTADQYGHTSALSAYHAAIELLPQLAALHLDLPSRQEILSNVPGTALASDAARCAITFGQFNIAVEFLEASRSVFWSQALHLRTPLEALAAVRHDLSTKLADISSQLEKASFRDTSRNLLIDTQHKIMFIESEGNHCRRLNEEWEEVIKHVQMLPGFENFLRSKDMTALRQAAVSGPIVVLTAGASSCFALIVTLSNDVQYLNLQHIDLPKVQLLANLSRALPNHVFDFGPCVLTNEQRNDLQNESESETRLFAGREGYMNMDPDDAFRELLIDLWKNIKSADPPRLWWCPTGRLAFLPFHAAGIYGPDITDCTSDYVISSYTPTITALLECPPHSTAPFKMTAIIQPETPGCDRLPGVREELKKIRERVPNQWLTALVHFACHGTQDLEHPLDSGLILADGRLKVLRIMHRPEQENTLDAKKSMSLAFLSACETAKGDKTVPDEAMHLASTLLFAGFHGVVATMWGIHDSDGPKIADTFYEHLFKNCDPFSNPPVLPDLRQAAKALQLAVAKLREEPNIPFRRWVPFIHYGL